MLSLAKVTRTRKKKICSNQNFKSESSVRVANSCPIILSGNRNYFILERFGYKSKSMHYKI